MRYNEFKPLAEDINTAVELPMRYYHGIYAEPTAEGVVVYGEDIEIDGDRDEQGWFDFRANLTTGHVEILATRSRWEGGDLSSDACRDVAGDLVEDVIKAYGTTWEEVEAELTGSWGIDETADADAEPTLADLDPPVIRSALDQLSGMVYQFKLGGSRLVLIRDQAQRLADQIRAIDVTRLRDLPVESLGTAVYAYWYEYLNPPHTMGGTRTRDHEFKQFLEDDVTFTWTGSAIEVSAGWGIDY